MNERIRKLMEQSMRTTGVEGLGGSYRELDPDTFAELIVRECAKIAYRVGEEASDVSDCGDAILENFDLPYLNGV